VLYLNKTISQTLPPTEKHGYLVNSDGDIVVEMFVMPPSDVLKRLGIKLDQYEIIAENLSFG
jgi:hypothetical protein